MADIARSFDDLNLLDRLSTGDSALHRLDPRAKLLTVMGFIFAVVSFPRYEISSLLPFFFFPAVLIPLADIPARFLVKKYLFLLPFAVLIGIFNPLFDREAVLFIGPVAVSGGMVSFLSIIIRFTLTVLAALILVAITGFNGVCLALERLKVPGVFCVQLMMLYRYIFVLSNEALKMARARELRSFGKQGKGFRPFASLIGHLLLRTWDRAQRVHMAMLSRGFQGEFYVRRPLTLKAHDVAFCLVWLSLFAFFRLFDLPAMIGDLLTGVTA
ncbi:MAG TPA: cobalt ECF transporter T component CbiQ [Deltaproteobacteria bacterium]|jgi:cobalt/nickel transport system permease protein|nr:cobalt ECF transporter T component CbiQ [Deltaproteobacteria bacterium]